MPKVDLGAVIGPVGADATINGVNALTLAAGDNVTLSQSGATLTISVDSITRAQLESALDAKISSVYKAGGSATLATLPALSAPNLGLVVNMTESFTTTSDFVEGAGKTYPAGSNVVVALIGSAYLYDVLAGFVDLSDYAHAADIPAKTSDLTNDSGFLTAEAQSVIDAAQNSRISDNETAVAAILAYLRSMEIYRTASGNPATFSDGYNNAPLKSLSVTITPTQDGTPSAETPVAILGYSSVTVARTGKNLLPPYKTQPPDEYSVYFSAGKKVSDGLTLPAGTYTLSYGMTGDDAGPFAMYWRHTPDLDASSFPAAASLGTAYSATVTLSRTEIVVFSVYRGGKAVPIDHVAWTQLESGSAATAYQPYQGQSVTVSLTDGSNPLTVYGGIVDLIAGTLTVTHDCIESYNGETVPDGWISSTGELSTGAQVVYPLASPLSYSLTPVSLTSLSGYNSVSADAGTLAVTYRADTSISLA